MDLDLYQRLAVSLAIGLIVGLERGWQARDEEEGGRVAGLRTYGLSGLLGGIAAVLSQATHALVLGAVFLGYAAATIVFHRLEAERENDLSVTGVVAALLTFALGALAVVGDLTLTVAAAVAMTILLALKQPLHRWLETLTWPEIRAVLTLLGMTFLLLPVLPTKAFDPWNTLVPAEIWLMAILIAAVSFAGYVAVRVLGEERGISVAALAGGLASSTAVTVTYSRLSREHPEASPLLAGGILIAGAVMMVRVAAIAGVVNPALFQPLALMLGAGAVVQGAVAAWLLRPGGERGRPGRLGMDNPFRLVEAIRLAALIAAVLLVARVAADQAGPAGLYAVAALSGIADVDAITLSLARLSVDQNTARTALDAIGLAVAVNTGVKAGIAVALGDRRAATIVGAASLAAIAAGGIAWWSLT